MKILAIDTSTGILFLSACDGDKVYEYSLELKNLSSVLLVPTIKRVMEALGWKISEIDYFCAGVGPGSFTGVRVGLATAKALSWSLNKPVVGISSLDILAGNVKRPCAFIIPVLDAKRGLVYSSIYKVRGGQVKRVAPYMLLSPVDLAQKIRKKVSAKAILNSVILGDGLNICAGDCRASLKGIKVLDKDYWRLEGKNMIELAKLAIREKRLNDAFGLKPLYLYPKECQIKHHHLKPK